MSKKQTNVDAQPNVVVPTLKTYRNNANYNEFLRDDEINTLPSLTLPEQSLSVKEILAHHTRGIPIDIGKVPIYHGDDVEFPDPRKLDLSELQQIREDFQREIAETKAKYEKEMEERKRKTAEEQAEYRAFYEDWKKQRAAAASEKSAMGSNNTK